MTIQDATKVSSSSEHLQVSHLARGQVLEAALQLGRHVRAYETVCIWLPPRRPQLHCLHAHLHVRNQAEGAAKEPGMLTRWVRHSSPQLAKLVATRRLHEP